MDLSYASIAIISGVLVLPSAWSNSEVRSLDVKSQNFPKIHQSMVTKAPTFRSSLLSRSNSGWIRSRDNGISIESGFSVCYNKYYDCMLSLVREYYLNYAHLEPGRLIQSVYGKNDGDIGQLNVTKFCSALKMLKKCMGSEFQRCLGNTANIQENWGKDLIDEDSVNLDQAMKAWNWYCDTNFGQDVITDNICLSEANNSTAISICRSSQENQENYCGTLSSPCAILCMTLQCFTRQVEESCGSSDLANKVCKFNQFGVTANSINHGYKCLTQNYCNSAVIFTTAPLMIIVAIGLLWL